MESETSTQESAAQPEVLEDESQFSEEELQDIQEIKSLERVLKSDPTLKSDIETIMRELFRKPVTPSTFGEIAVGLRNHIEFDDMAFLVAFLLSDDESVQKLYQENTSPETWNWLRLMLALYGEATKEAQTISGKNEDAWRVANRRVYFDTVTNQWGVTLEIIKYNGEKITLEETPRDALFLAEGIVNALNTVPPDAMAEESLIPREDVRYFLADVITLSENYAPGLLVELAQEVAKEEQQAESGQVMEE